MNRGPDKHYLRRVYLPFIYAAKAALMFMTSSSVKANDLLVSKIFYPCDTKSHLLFWGVYIAPPIFLTFPRNWWLIVIVNIYYLTNVPLAIIFSCNPITHADIKHRIAFIPTVSMLYFWSIMGQTLWGSCRNMTCRCLQVGGEGGGPDITFQMMLFPAVTC